jgi:NDP-sugar pyrophosphorylase family protein
MAVKLHEWQNPYGVVTTKGLNIINYSEKPKVHSYINAGIYVFEPTVLDLIDKHGPFDMPYIFEVVQNSKKNFISYPIYEQWVDLGLPEDLNYARAYGNKENYS